MPQFNVRIKLISATQEDYIELNRVLESISVFPHFEFSSQAESNDGAIEHLCFQKKFEDLAHANSMVFGLVSQTGKKSFFTVMKRKSNAQPHVSLFNEGNLQ